MDAIQKKVQVIKTESEQLVDYVNGLPDESLSRPSACTRWEVGDVIAHWVWFMDYYTGVLVSRALNGDTSPVPDRPEGESVAELDAYHATRAILRRGRLGDRLRETFTAMVTEMNIAFAQRSLEDWEKPMRTFSGINSVGLILDLAIQEFPLHGWDIRSRLEQSAAMIPESVWELMDWIPKRFRMPWFVEFSPDSRLEAPVTFRFQIPDAVTDLTVVDNQVEFLVAANTKADVHLHCDSETFVLLMYERLSLQQAAENGRLSVEGDLHLTEALDQYLKRI